MKHGTLKRRWRWWTHPHLWIIAGILSLIGLPMVWWIDTYGNHVATGMFVITYWSLLVIGIFLLHRLRMFSMHYVDEKKIRQTKEEISGERTRVRRELIEKEISLLRQGSVAPVLDIWRLDPFLQSRHPLFSSVESSTIEPNSREFLLRIQLEELEWEGSGPEAMAQRFLREVCDFVNVIGTDAYFSLVKAFFDTMVMECYSERLNSQQRMETYSFLSLLIKRETLERAIVSRSLTLTTLRRVSDLRFENGNEIEPHRGIPATLRRGGK